MSSDAPITRVTALEFQPDSNVKYNGLYPPHLTPQERDAIEKIPSNIAGIIYNTQTQDLEYLAPTYNWIAVATAGGDFSFEDLTVTHDLSVGHDLTVTHDATVINNFHVLSDTTLNTVAATTLFGGKVIGPRAGGSFYTTVPDVLNLNSTPVKIPNTTAFAHSGYGFDEGSAYNKIRYTRPANYPATIEVFVHAIVSLGIIGAATTYSVYLYKNGAWLSTSMAICQLTASTGNPAVFTIAGPVSLVANDYLELWMSSDDISNGNLAQCSMTVMQL